MAEFPYWMQHGGHYRPIQDLTTPWVPSPLTHEAKTAPYTYVERLVHKRVSVSERSVQLASSRRKRRPGVLGLLRALVKGEGQSELREPVRQESWSVLESEEVQLHEWKAWGYYARPKLPISSSRLSFEFIRNYPPEGPISPSVDVNERFASLQRPETHRWLPGLQHPALPPRPRRWKSPVVGGPQPFPWELQLNPFLQHRIVGLTPVCWDISVEPARVLMGYELLISERSIPLSDADKAQPATYPFVTHMYINGIADYPLDHFPWPIMIRNDSGITCADVFEGIWRDFSLHVSVDSWEGWNAFQRDQIRAAFEVRRGEERGDAVRRHDILGTHRMFRGLEPHPNLEGWMMFLGIA